MLSSFEEDNEPGVSGNTAVILLDETARKVLCRLSSIEDKGLESKMQSISRHGIFKTVITDKNEILVIYSDPDIEDAENV